MTTTAEVQAGWYGRIASALLKANELVGRQAVIAVGGNPRGARGVGQAVGSVSLNAEL